MSNRSIHRSIHRLFVTGATALVLIWSSAVSLATTRQLLVHGTPERYWIARVDQDPAGGIKTYIQMRREDPPQWTRIAQPSARVISLANRGTELAALLDTGDWMLLWEGGASSGALPQDGSRLIQLLGGKETLWGVTTSGQGRAPTTTGATQPAATMPVGTRLLERLDRGEWVALGALPSEAQDGQISLVQHSGKIMLAALGQGGDVATFNWNAGQSTWESAGIAKTGPDTTYIKLLPDLGRPVLWAGNRTGIGGMHLHGIEWTAVVPLPLPAGTESSEFYDISVAMRSVRLDLADLEGKIVECSYAPDGLPHGATALAPPIVPQEQKQFEWFGALMLAAFTLVLINSMRRGGTAPENAEALSAYLAPHGRRMLAAAIDALPIIITMIGIAWSVDAQSPDDVTARLDAAKLPYLLSVAGYVLHTMVCEMLWGWSVGKKLCGLRVVMADGSAPTPRALVVRNLLRVVDTALLLSPLIVLISPLHQRVGDLAADTIVVDARAPETPVTQAQDAEEAKPDEDAQE